MYKESNPKIDVYLNGEYQYSTNWCGTCKEAKQKFITNNPLVDPKQVKACIDHK